SIFSVPPVSLSMRSTRMRRWSCSVMLAGQVDCTFRFREVCACTARLSAAANKATTVLFIRAPRDWSVFLRPELLRRKPGAFGERFELRPHDARMHAPVKRPLREAAVGAGE